MRNAAVVYAIDKAEQFAKMGAEVRHLKSNLLSFAKNAKGAFRKGRRAVGGFVDETTLCIEKQPLKAIGLTLGAGVGIGVLAGWLATRK